MVFEIIVSSYKNIEHPVNVLLWTIVITFVSSIISNVLFPDQASMLTLFFITLLFAPLFQRLFDAEERKDEKIANHKTNKIDRWHKRVFLIFSYLFMGVLIEMTAMYVFLPDLSQNVFTLQAKTLERMGNSDPAGASYADTGFFKIFYNNVGVALLILATSLLFGAGANCIIVWNASVIALFIGYFIKDLIAQGMPHATAYIYGMPVGMIRIMLHGVPEILAYFIIALAGGILSIAVVREHVFSKRFRTVLKDSGLLVIAAFILLLAAAWLEVVF